MYNEDDISRLRSWISLTATQGGAAGEDGNEGKAGGEGDGATEMEALRAFAESVGYKGDIMDGVVTACAGGAIEEIHWRVKNLDGRLPMGDLNMPKLRMLDLEDNERLKGERERERERESESARARTPGYAEGYGMREGHLP